MSEDLTKNVKNVAFVGPSEIDSEDIVCPKCKNAEIVLTGKVFRVFIEEVHPEATTVKTIYDEEMDEIDQIICMSCETCFVVVTQHMYDLLHKDDDFLEEIGLKGVK
jgi:hypothetical protein